MPIKGARYRVTRRGGKKIRLAFVGNKVVETKDLSTPGAQAHKVSDRERVSRKHLQSKRGKRK